MNIKYRLSTSFLSILLLSVIITVYLIYNHELTQTKYITNIVKYDDSEMLVNIKKINTSISNSVLSLNNLDNRIYFLETGQQMINDFNDERFKGANEKSLTNAERISNNYIELMNSIEELRKLSDRNIVEINNEFVKVNNKQIEQKVEIDKEIEQKIKEFEQKIQDLREKIDQIKLKLEKTDVVINSNDYNKLSEEIKDIQSLFYNYEECVKIQRPKKN